MAKGPPDHGGQHQSPEVLLLHRRLQVDQWLLKVLYKTEHNFAGTIKILDSQDRDLHIDRLPHGEAPKALSYLQAPHGNMKAEHEEMIGTIKEWTSNMYQSFLNCWLIWSGANTTIFCSINEMYNAVQV